MKRQPGEGVEPDLFVDSVARLLFDVQERVLGTLLAAKRGAATATLRRRPLARR